MEMALLVKGLPWKPEALGVIPGGPVPPKAGRGVAASQGKKAR